MSSTTWTRIAVESEARRADFKLWRAVEAQHVVSTMALVDSVAEQTLLESLIEAQKPAPPASADDLHWLLYTPFRYPPLPGGSRFRAPTDPGMFYGADEIRTCCAELGYWRWRFLMDSPGLGALEGRPQTIFRVAVATTMVDLRRPPFLRDRRQWTDREDYAPTQAFARVAREAALGAIRYESVRDPDHGGCGAVLTPAAFAEKTPQDVQSWWLSVTPDRVIWRNAGITRSEAWEFATSLFTKR